MTDDEYAVEITLGIPGEGARSITLDPGEVFAEIVGSTYVEVAAPELPEGPDGVKVEYVSTEEQDESANGDREWTIETTRCGECGSRYPVDYSRCHKCGEENPGLEELEP